jgi:hypothetical protein
MKTDDQFIGELWFTCETVCARAGSARSPVSGVGGSGARTMMAGAGCARGDVDISDLGVLLADFDRSDCAW